MKQNEGCMYIGVANKLFDTLSLRILLPSALMRDHQTGDAISLLLCCPQIVAAAQKNENELKTRM